jgi:hypothetical protein
VLWPHAGIARSRIFWGRVKEGQQMKNPTRVWKDKETFAENLPRQSGDLFRKYEVTNAELLKVAEKLGAELETLLERGQGFSLRLREVDTEMIVIEVAPSNGKKCRLEISLVAD